MIRRLLMLCMLCATPLLAAGAQATQKIKRPAEIDARRADLELRLQDVALQKMRLDEFELQRVEEMAKLHLDDFSLKRLPDVELRLQDMALQKIQLEDFAPMKLEGFGKVRLDDLRLDALKFESGMKLEKMGKLYAPGAFPTRAHPSFPSDSADSLYKVAREALNRGEYRRAAQLFRDVEKRYPKSAYAPDALYWQAFSLYRVGSTDELQDALKALELQQSRYVKESLKGDVAVLATRIRGALASRGDSRAATALEREAAQQGTACDKEDQAVRAEALSALSQMDPEATTPILRRVLARKDDCSAPLRRRALFLLGRRNDAAAVELLTSAAKSDPDTDVRAEAVTWLARVPGDQTVAVLEDLVKSSTDERVQRAAVRSLASHDSPRARAAIRAFIERNDTPERLRAEAVGAFINEHSTTEDVTFLRTLYGKVDNQNIKEQIVYAVSRAGGADDEQWLMGLVRNAGEPMSIRTSALYVLARGRPGFAGGRGALMGAGRGAAKAERTAIPIGDLVKLYDSVAERPLREALLNALASRPEPEATDKLLDIVKSGTDPQLRRAAIQALTRKNDPRATKLLLEIIDRQ